jgi:hypothetical protein
MSGLFWRLTRRVSVNSLRRQPRLSLEALESRDLLSGFNPEHILLPTNGGATPFGSPGPTGTTPTQIRHAYGFDQVSYNGAGQTIAIVDAYDDPNIANDLHQFDVRFGLADPTFTKVNQSGGTSLPAANGGWASEIALDVEWAHAIAPGANILLVEANDNSFNNLLSAVRYAAGQQGVVAVSMSWGGGEFNGETSYDSNFTTPAGHAGVTFVASSGDSGAPIEYPAASPNVLSVGGTTLNLDGSGNILSESAWSGSGGGISSFEAQPSYQNGVVTQSSTSRTNPDVAYDADPNTGFPVYDSYNNGTSAPWSQFGGTSDAAPQWAALIAIADQARAANGLTSLDGRSQTLPQLYSMTASNYHDITSGSSIGSPNEPATSGYDLATGRGTPYANLIIASLAGQSSTPGATHFSVSVPASATAGSSFTVTVTALTSTNQVATNYLGTVHFTSSDGQAVLPGDYPFVSGDHGVHSFTVTLKTAGSRTVTVTDTASSSTTGSGTVNVSPAAASKLAFSQQPTNVGTGAVITPAVTVWVLDAYGNLVNSDNTDQVTLAIGSNPGGGTLGGTTTVTVGGGIATFSNLTISQAGNGYTLTASSTGLTGSTSSSFNVGTTSHLIEGFETSGSWNVVGGSLTAYRSTAAAHDGTYGLDMYNGSDWIYRNDSAAQVRAGDTVSVWVQLNGSANGRAYFGFGASSSGTLSLVAAPNTGQFIIQENLGYNYANLAAVKQSYVANHWYRLEVDWGTSGTIVGKLFDSNGTTLLNSVVASTTDIMGGGIAFRALANDKFFDTVTDTPGVNNFVVSAAIPTGAGSSLDVGGSRNPFGMGLFGALGGQGSATLPSTSSASLNAPAPTGLGGLLPGRASADHFFTSALGGSHTGTTTSQAQIDDLFTLFALERM